MGATMWVLVMLIVLIAVGYTIWALVAAGRGAVSAGKSLTSDDSNETAPHSDERTHIRRVDTTPPYDRPSPD